MVVLEPPCLLFAHKEKEAAEEKAKADALEKKKKAAKNAKKV
jgi:hypothetical protein